ncbi:MAG: ArnT family glycosyltransferase [Bacteroidota bacterium]
MIKRLSINQTTVFIGIFAALIFVPFIGSVHLFDWDEINFAECAREMIVSGNYSTVQINYQPFWEKPPLFIWFQVISMKIFGINEFAARLPNALCGIITLMILYRLGTRLRDSVFGWLWVFSFCGSILPFFYFKSGIIDPWFNLFIFLSIYHLIIFSNSPNEKSSLISAVWSGVFIGLATLTKGPVALLIFCLCLVVYFVIGRFRNIFSLKWFLLFAFSFLLVSGSWFGYIALTGNTQLIFDFIEYQIRLFSTQDSGHGGFFGYHFVVLLFGCFPASIFFIRGLRKDKNEIPYVSHFKKWMLILFWVVLILFSIVKTKIVHYSSLCYFPLTFLSAYSIQKIIDSELEIGKWMKNLLLVIGTLLGFVFTILPLTDNFKNYIIQNKLIDDRFTIDSLSVDAGWMGWEWIPGLLLILFSFFIYRFKGRTLKAVVLLFTFVISFTFFIMAVIVPKVEKYSQGPQIEFYTQLRGKMCYAETVNYKSYANLFYSEKRPELNTIDLVNHVNEKIQLAKKNNQEIFSFNLYATNYTRGEKIIYPAYFVVKTNHIDVFKKECPKITELYRKGGYVFLYRPSGSIK